MFYYGFHYAQIGLEIYINKRMKNDYLHFINMLAVDDLKRPWQ